jgi:ABC-type lipoprotein release transport system permease subunit
LLLGVPLGLLAGSLVFRVFVEGIGAIPDPTIPILAIVVVCLGLVVMANLAALWPARRARLLPAAELLRKE